MDIERAWHRTVTFVTLEKDIGAVGPGYSRGYSSVKWFWPKFQRNKNEKFCSNHYFILWYQRSAFLGQNLEWQEAGVWLTANLITKLKGVSRQAMRENLYSSQWISNEINIYVIAAKLHS